LIRAVTSRAIEQVGHRSGGSRIAALLQHAGGQPDHDQADGDVHDEDPVPGGLDEQPAHHRTERGGDSTQQAPDPHGAGTALRGERGEQQGEGGGRGHRGTQGLHDARGHEELHRARQRAQQAAEGEHGHADREATAPPDAVAEPAQRGEQRREGHRVGVQHPGQPGQVGHGEVPGDVGQGDVDDEQVQVDQEDGHARQDEGPGGQPGRGLSRWV
jgi:hypothetical protein